MSTFSSEAADWEQSGYGPLLATPSVRVSPFPMYAWGIQYPDFLIEHIVGLAISSMEVEFLTRHPLPQAHPGLTAASFPWPNGEARSHMA